MKRFLIILLISLNIFLPSYANCNTTGQMKVDFCVDDIPTEVYFKIDESIIVDNFIVIPENSIIKAKVVQYQKERRWHKSGYIICQANSYIANDEPEKDVSGQEIFFVIRKYEAIDKKEASKTVAEVSATTGASLLLPGADIAYYFTKGAIQKSKDENWFKSGVSNAYENSIFWFWLKGKPIELTDGDSIKIKPIEKQKAEKLKTKIDKQQQKEVEKKIKNN